MPVIDDQLIQQLSNHIKNTIGLHFPSGKYNDLRFKFTELSKENGYANTNEFVKYVLENKSDKLIIEKLSSKLTIGETYFWRDRELFRTLESKILPDLINKKQSGNKTIRIWSAACSSGEEPYSIAILLKRMIPSIKEWNILINATDINPNVIKKAVEGKYTEWSFRSAPPWLKEEYFVKKNKEYHLDESIKRMVNFSYLNFFEDVYPSLTNDTNSMDIIFCRNVLMYFAQEDIKVISDKLYDCLLNDGLLITTASESFQYLSPRFKNVHYKNTTVYQRKDIEEESGNKNQFKANHKTLITQTTETALNYKPTQIKNRNRIEKKKEAPRRVISKEIDPTFDDALEAYNSGNTKIARQIINNLPVKEKNQSAYLLLSRILANEGKLKEALNECETLISKYKLIPEAYYLMATIQIELGKSELAYKTLQKSLYLNPEFIIAHFMLGNLAFNEGDFTEANKHFKNTLHLLNNIRSEESVPESDGITAGRLKEIIYTYLIN